MAAWAPLVSGVHRLTIRFTPTPGESFGLAGPPGNGLTLVGTQPLGAGPASSLYVSYGPCSSVPASGCHHRPVQDAPTGLPEQALNLFLPAVSPSGTRKTRTKFAFTLSGRSADNLATPAARTTPGVLQSSIINRQSPIACPTAKEPPSNDNRPATTRPPPPATAMPPPAGSALVATGPSPISAPGRNGAARATDAI